MAHIVKLISNANSAMSEESLDKILLRPLTYIRQTPGKGLSSRCAQALNHWLNVPADVLKLVEDLLSMLHDTSLLLDDVEDNSDLRRGVPAAHLVYGAHNVINSSRYIMFLGMKMMLNLEHPEAVNVFVDEVLEVHRGQGMDIYWRDNFICPTEEEYCEMVKLKASVMLPLRIMQLFSENKNDYAQLSGMYSIYFQIRDDYCNLCDQSYADKKTYCEDLTEGKFSFPIIHAIRSQPADSQIAQILRIRTTDNALKKHCVSLLEKCGSLRYTKEVLTRMDKELREEVKRLGGNPDNEKILDDLLTWQNI